MLIGYHTFFLMLGISTECQALFDLQGVQSREAHRPGRILQRVIAISIVLAPSAGVESGVNELSKSKFSQTSCKTPILLQPVGCRIPVHLRC
ncbi:uncharacterized protein EDB93DRAFT_1184536 [Suillus bovinus]|uniref:uncharacterized protein n=1 Tax=Suillus bovinus TaxID=48563 RepID=UPI001B87BC94|nr:uncharacterized protein EDB93DRAFT_1184536 [Suillus bovinus]KAG2128529.1 hypothetical protein EDB93DRAFT_1184536 [Suillus bovinus]